MLFPKQAAPYERQALKNKATSRFSSPTKAFPNARQAQVKQSNRKLLFHGAQKASALTKQSLRVAGAQQIKQHQVALPQLTLTLTVTLTLTLTRQVLNKQSNIKLLFHS